MSLFFLHKINLSKYKDKTKCVRTKYDKRIKKIDKKTT